jgi:hypothetical protein
MNGFTNIALSVVFLIGFDLSGLVNLQRSRLTQALGVPCLTAVPATTKPSVSQLRLAATVGGDSESQEARFYFASSDTESTVWLNGTLTVLREPE